MNVFSLISLKDCCLKVLKHLPVISLEAADMVSQKSSMFLNWNFHALKYSSNIGVIFKALGIFALHSSIDGHNMHGFTTFPIYCTIILIECFSEGTG
jgi:hypothetical protein